MAEPLKNLYNKAYFLRIFNSLKILDIEISEDSFLKQVFSQKWTNLELKDRMRHLAQVINNYLSINFHEKARQVVHLANDLEKSKSTSDGFLAIFLPQIIEDSGQDYLKESCRVFEAITYFTTCEFAVRPFIEKYPEAMMVQMLKWTKSKDEHVRRLASEGCRPLLPWGGILRELKNDPSPILPILENLKNDKSEYVRRSVANNLNDISKDYPQVLIDLLAKWQKEPEPVQKLLKHALRTLLKAGNKEVLNYFGWYYDDKIKVENLKLNSKVILGGKLEFSFPIKNKGINSRKLRLEYAIYFRKANSSLTKKVFQISNGEIKPSEQKLFSSKFSFKPITTRKYYS